MHAPTCIFWPNLTSFSLKLGDWICVVSAAVSAAITVWMVLAPGDKVAVWVGIFATCTQVSASAYRGLVYRRFGASAAQQTRAMRIFTLFDTMGYASGPSHTRAAPPFRCIPRCFTLYGIRIYCRRRRCGMTAVPSYRPAGPFFGGLLYDMGGFGYPAIFQLGCCCSCCVLPLLLQVGMARLESLRIRHM